MACPVMFCPITRHVEHTARRRRPAISKWINGKYQLVNTLAGATPIYLLTSFIKALVFRRGNGGPG